MKSLIAIGLFFFASGLYLWITLDAIWQSSRLDAPAAGYASPRRALARWLRRSYLRSLRFVRQLRQSLFSGSSLA